MGYRAEVWTRPGASTFTHVDTIDSPIKLGATRRGGGLGEGDMSLPADLDATRLNSILFADKDAPANDVTALIRYYRDGQTSGEDAPFFEWLADGRVPPSTVEQPNLTVSGLDINSLFGWASVEAWDWDGSADWQSNFPDWIWGGRNLLGTLEGRYKPEVVTLTITATSGTVTLTVTNDSGSDTTDPVAFNATALTWKLELQDLTNVGLVEVDGPAGGPFRITFTDPNTNTIVGGSAGTQRTVVQEGGFVPVGYELSRSYVSELPHGEVVEFRMWETGDPALPAGCDTAVMFNGTEPDYPGFQRRVRVRPGGVYQVRSKVTSTVAGDDVRMVVRDMAENEIGGAGNARDEQTIAVAGTFQDFEIQNLVIPEDVSEVLVRWGHVDEPGVDPGRIFVACPEFREGLAATTVGAILTALYNDAQTDHVGDGRQVWGSGPFLELDFDASNDSGGSAWSESEVSVRFNMNTNYSLVLAEFGRRGYEWRIIPKQSKTANPADDGVWLLQVFNPDGAGVDYSAAPDPAILSGTDVVARAARMFAPSATMVRVQGADGYTSRSVSADAVGAVGRREAGVQSPDLFSLVDTAAVSAAELADRLSRAESISPTVRPTPGVDPVPGVDFDVFDTLNVADVPYVAKAERRLAAWTATFTADIPEGEFLLSFTAETFVGQSAVNAGVRRLLREFEAIRQAPIQQVTEGEAALAADGKIPYLVVGTDAPDQLKRVAGFICDGADDQTTIGEAISQLAAGSGGEVLLAGTFALSGTITLAAGVSLRGFGISATVLDYAPTTGPVITVASDLHIRDLFILGSVTDIGIGGTDQDRVTIDNVWFASVTKCIDLSGDYWTITNCGESTIGGGATYFLQDDGPFTRCRMVNNNVRGDIDMGDGTDWLVEANNMEGAIIADGGTRGVIVGNVWLDGANPQTVGSMIQVANFSDLVVGSNIIPANGWNGINLDTVIQAIVASNSVWFGDVNIILTGCTRVIVTANHTKWPASHNIHLSGCTECNVTANQVIAATSADNIRLAGDRNMIEGNMSQAVDGFSVADVGINIVSGSCNIVVGNRLGDPADYGTDALTDSGTDTQLTYPNDPTYGDNFTDCGGSPSSP